MSGVDGRFVPEARVERLTVEELDGEVLVYDLDRHEAHCLNDTSALVWRACDGRRSVSQIAASLPDVPAGVDPLDIVRNALSQLEARRLLAHPLPEAATGNASRRELLKRVAIAGAVGLALPIVRSIVAPEPVQAATCKEPGLACTASSECCSGLCMGNGICA